MAGRDARKLTRGSPNKVPAVAADQRAQRASFGGGRVDSLECVAGAKDAVDRQQPQGWLSLAAGGLSCQRLGPVKACPSAGEMLVGFIDHAGHHGWPFLVLGRL